MEALSADGEAAVQRLLDGDLPPRDQEPIECPECNRRMDTTGYAGRSDVFIDRCGRCWLVWLDPFEAELMAALYAQANGRIQEHRSALDEIVKRRMASMSRRVLTPKSNGGMY